MLKIVMMHRSLQDNFSDYYNAFLREIRSFT